MVIILEGPDGSGKTSLARRLEKEWGMIYSHEGPPPDNKDDSRLDYYAVTLIRALRRKQPTVFDRFHLGELVYGPVARSSDRLGYGGMRLMRRLCFANHVLIKICQPPYDVALENWRRKLAAGDDYVRDERKFFDTYYRFKALTAYEETFDYTHDYDQQYYDLTNKLQGPCQPLPKGMIGRPEAQVLFVGERSNSKREDLDLPFFSMTQSAGYLNRAIWEAGFHEREIAFVNAYKLNQMENDLNRAVQALPNLKVAVTLGDKAKHLLSRQLRPGVNVESLPHPQYWKRFNNGRTDEYTERLKEVRETWITHT
jgi:hypothetical protein